MEKITVTFEIENKDSCEGCPCLVADKDGTYCKVYHLEARIFSMRRPAICKAEAPEVHVTTKEKALWDSEMLVVGLKVMQSDLNSHAKTSGRVKPSECPIVKGWENSHAIVASFLAGGGLGRWECPFCGEAFSI